MTESRTALDFAEVLRYTSDVLYLGTEKIILVTDNLNTHSRQKKHVGFQNVSNGIILQSTEAAGYG